MRGRTVFVAALVMLLLAPGLWAALARVRANEAMELALAAARAHERVGYAGALQRTGCDGHARRGRRGKDGRKGKDAQKSARTRKSIAVVHDAAHGRTRYRFGERRSFVCAGPSSRMRDPAAWCTSVAALPRAYTAAITGRGTLLGRATIELRLTPRYKGRPRLDLTVDAATSLPLRVCTKGDAGAPERESVYASLAIAPQTIDEAPSPERYARWFGSRVAPGEAAATAGFQPYLPAWLPAGFELRECRIVAGPLPKVRLSFADGVTVFELTENLIPTPAQMESAFTQRHGAQRAARYLRGWKSWRMRALARALAEDGALEREGGDGIVRRREYGSHRFHELVLGDLEVRAVARTDLDADLVLAVLRSLRRDTPVAP